MLNKFIVLNIENSANWPKSNALLHCNRSLQKHRFPHSSDTNQVVSRKNETPKLLARSRKQIGGDRVG